MGVLLSDNEVDEVLHDWLCGESCICQTRPVAENSHLTPASIHGDTRKWDLMRIVVGQREEAQLPDNGWHDIFCVENEAHSEVYQGSLEHFAEMLYDLGWGVENVRNSQAICPACQNPPMDVSEEDEREDFKVQERRKEWD